MSVVELQRSGPVAVVTLNRPEARNALDPEMIVRLGRAWDEVRDDAGVRVCVLTAAPGPSFCAGFDLATFLPLLTGGPPTDEWGELIAADPSAAAAAATLRHGDLGKPLIAAVNGHAIAGGLELLLTADLRVLAEDARIGAGAVNVGMILTMGGTARLALQTHAALAAELLLTGSLVDAPTALAAGLVNRVVPSAEVLTVALSLAATIAANAPLAVRAAREIVRAAPALSAAALFELERLRGEELAATADAVEGPLAFVEKRPANFLGR